MPNTENAVNFPEDFDKEEVEVVVEPQVQRHAYNTDGSYFGSIVCTEAQYEEFLSSEGLVSGERPEPTISREAVNNERDRRTQHGIPFMGKVLQFDTKSKENILGAAVQAKFALMAGVAPDDYTWHVQDAEEKATSLPFAWIASDNSLLPLNTQDMSDLGDFAAKWEQLHVFYAHTLKSMPVIPLDYEDDKYWP